MDDLVKLTDSEAPFLAPDEPPAFDVINPDGEAHLVLICDHAGRNIPRVLDGLGVPEDELERHIAYDIGARRVTELLSGMLDAVALMHNYSRLVIDCNRPLGHPESMPEISDGTLIPGNERLTADAAQSRADTLFWPYHQAISTEIGNRWRTEGVPPVLFSIHSFTPNFDDKRRPWDAGVLYNQDSRIGHPLKEILEGEGLHIGDNEPYSGAEAAFTIDIHGTSPGIANGVIEIRQDQVENEAGQDRWARLLAGALRQLITRDHMFRVQRP